VLGAVLAVCDSLEGVTGRDVLLAVALGLDVSCRIALASTLDRGWHRTAAIGIFGATAAAGKLIGLTPEQMLAAFGIAYSHAAGNRQCILDGALTKRMQAGQAASAGVFSAILAQTGFTGAHNIFSGRFGFFELYQPNGYDASVLLRDLGAAFRGEALSYKPYPCGRPLHAAIDAALATRARLEIERPDDIASVTIEADAAGHGDQFAGGPTKRRPTQVVEAQFAQPFLVATALAHGRVGIAEVDGLGMKRSWRCRIGSPASRGMADRKGRSASLCTGPTGARLPSRPAIPSGRQRSRLAMPSSRQSSATARVMPCGRCRRQAWMGYWRQSDDWKPCRMHARCSRHLPGEETRWSTYSRSIAATWSRVRMRAYIFIALSRL